MGINSIKNLKQIVGSKINFSRNKFDFLNSDDKNLIDPRKW